LASLGVGIGTFSWHLLPKWPDPQFVVDAMSMRLFAGLEMLTRRLDGVADRLFPGKRPDMRGLRHRIAQAMTGHGATGADRPTPQSLRPWIRPADVAPPREYSNSRCLRRPVRRIGLRRGVDRWVR